MKKIKSLLFLSFFISINILCQNKLTDFVNPFIGTGGHGHTFPGASLPFGMVQLSPDTDTEGWDWCSGYHYSDSSIIGFSHTHLSGTGCGDYGDILFMPITGNLKLNPGSKNDPDSGYRSRFSHKKEIAKPGYYSVYLEDYKINVELTTTERSGLHRYTFPQCDSSYILIDLSHGIQDKAIDSYVEIISNKVICGYRKSTGWAKEHTVYFYAEFSKPFKSYGIVNNNVIHKNIKKLNGSVIKVFLEYDTESKQTILVKVGISHTDLEGAKRNLMKEIPHWNFEKIRKDADEKWNNMLSLIKVEDDNSEKKRIFYTALYHAFLTPNIFSDVDKRYFGMDGKIHTAEDFTMYTVFSLWDTFRALHPLLTIVDRSRALDMVKSLIAKYEESGLLPVWELASNETGTMIGYHAVSVIADAIMKGIKQFDIEKAYEAMKKSSMQDKLGLFHYKNMGYIPSDMENESVSKTLEFCYDDWCIAQIAKMLGKDEEYKYYLERSRYYLNLFDPQTKFFRPKKNGKWIEPFDPFYVSKDFTEANAWQYLFFVPHDVEGLSKLMWGYDNFENMLDKLFSAESKLYGKYQPDISGLIGQYAHGNEPSHHIAYLYNFIGKPWKTQKLIYEISNKFYTDKPDGLIGNEDCGQMSAWYIFSSLGFYPVCPGDNNYIIGTPNFKKVTVKVNRNKYFSITTKNLSKKNYYIRNVFFNNNEYPLSYITHNQIIKGGEITFEMDSIPSKWAADKKFSPISQVELEFIPIPYLSTGEKIFKDSTYVSLSSIINGEIYYSFGDDNPIEKGIRYSKPILIKSTSNINFVGYYNQKYSKTVKSFFYKIPENWSIKYNTKYSSSYTGGGDWGLIDGIKGNENFNSDLWQGYESDDLDVVIDLGALTLISYINSSYLQKISSWIFYPKEVKYFISKDGSEFTQMYDIEISKDDKSDGIKNIEYKFEPTYARYVHVIAKNIGICPPWHVGAGKKAWLFIDEITIK